MDILVSVVGQRLKAPCNAKKIMSGSRKFVRIVFALSSDWYNLIAHAKFFQGENTYDAVLDEDNSCYVPSEMVQGTFSVMLYGIGGAGGTIIATTESLDFLIVDPLYSPTGDESEETDYDEDYVATTSETLSYLGIE